MNQQNDTVDRVRALLGPANPVPGSIDAASWQDHPSAQELRVRIAAEAIRPARPRQHHRAARQLTGWLTSGLRARLLAPVLAGAAVALIAVLVVVVGAPSQHRSATLPTRGGQGSQVGGGSAAGRGGMPPFYLTLQMQGAVTYIEADVHSSQTGQVLSSRHVGYPGMNNFGIAADGNGGRSFLIYAAASAYASKSAVHVWRLTLSADGTSTTLRELPLVLLPNGSYDVIDGIAVSPDGAKLAVALQLGQKDSNRVLNSHMEMLVYSLAGGGATQVWTAPSDVAEAWNPVWTSPTDLTFVWQDQFIGNAVFSTGRSQIRVLDTAQPSRDLLSSQVIATGGGNIGYIQSADAGPGDSPVIAATFSDATAANGSGTATVKLVSLTPDGTVGTVFSSSQVSYNNRAQMETADTNCQVLAADAGGQHMLAYCPTFGRIDNGRFTELPGNAGAPDAAW
jgi:hypothetical protein